jgi:hypothetical protein
MTIEFHCPHCQKVLKTADDRAGMRANCPGCGEALTVPTPTHEAAQSDPAAPPASGLADPDSAMSGTSGPAAIMAAAPTVPGDSRPCPMCGKEIKRAATRCRFCGESLIGRQGDSGVVPLEAGDVLTQSWEIFQKNLGLLVGSTLVLMGIAMVSVLMGYAGMVAAMIAIGGAGQGPQGPDTAAVVAFVAIVVLFVIFVFAVNAYLQGGFNLLLLRIVRGERAELGDMFGGGRFFWRLFWGNILFTLLTYVGLALLIVPAVFVMLIFCPFSYVIVDQNVGVAESFRKSRELTGGNLLAIFILGLAMMGINMLGQMACYVGMIFSIPLTALIFAVAYCRMSGQEIAGGRQAT